MTVPGLLYTTFAGQMPRQHRGLVCGQEPENKEDAQAWDAQARRCARFPFNMACGGTDVRQHMGKRTHREGSAVRVTPSQQSPERPEPDQNIQTNQLSQKTMKHAMKVGWSRKVIRVVGLTKPGSLEAAHLIAQLQMVETMPSALGGGSDSRATITTPHVQFRILVNDHGWSLKCGNKLESNQSFLTGSFTNLADLRANPKLAGSGERPTRYTGRQMSGPLPTAELVYRKHLPTTGLFYRKHLPTTGLFYRKHLPTTGLFYRKHLPTPGLFYRKHLPTPGLFYRKHLPTTGLFYRKHLPTPGLFYRKHLPTMGLIYQKHL
ncbi:hypothetical protein P7K49_027802 [Saguinus oedipus]|uniref:Uncharacterized protein n=1 Tax=Saguinus oedipus TaxID=9490 RepID=A0ABQ9UAH3_SAGOE|nr:hypothetical protein P7K49_027802 [Saguinus oedipus]